MSECEFIEIDVMIVFSMTKKKRKKEIEEVMVEKYIFFSDYGSQYLRPDVNAKVLEPIPAQHGCH